MAFVLYEHPLSSYCQKAKTAFYEKGVPFETRMLDGSEPVASEFAALWPIGKFPVVTDGERLVFDATTIIEYLDETADGRILGEYRSMGLRPYTIDKAKQFGFDQAFLESCL